MKPRLLAAVAGLALIGLSACNPSPAENKADAIEDQADAVRGAGDNTADAMEDQAEALGNNSMAESKMAESAENKAAGVRDNAENKADVMEDQADKVRDGATR